MAQNQVINQESQTLGSYAQMPYAQNPLYKQTQGILQSFQNPLIYQPGALQFQPLGICKWSKTFIEFFNSKYWHSCVQEVPANVVQQLAQAQQPSFITENLSNNLAAQLKNCSDPNIRHMDLACNQSPCRKDPTSNDQVQLL